MKKLTQEEKLNIYFQPENNRWTYDVAQDQKGRALLPMDQVCFPLPSDEGIMLMLRGTVLGERWEYGGELLGLVPVQVDRHFCETFKIPPIMSLPTVILMRMPSDVWLNNTMAQKITESNTLTVFQAGGRLHINKVPIVIMVT